MVRKQRSSYWGESKPTDGAHIVEITRFKDDFEVKWTDLLGVGAFLVPY